MEYVDVLVPPNFEKSGITKSLVEAWEAGDWIGTFNLWIVQNEPVPALVYQVRSPKSSWAPGKLDVTAGGHLSAGEEMYDGIREVKEELGRSYSSKELLYLGRKMNVSIDIKGRERKNLVHVCLVKDNSPITSYILEEREVYGVSVCPLDELYKVHTESGYSFEGEVLTASGSKEKMDISSESFPYNWDNYHFKIVLLARRFLAGEKDLIY